MTNHIEYITIRDLIKSTVNFGINQDQLIPSLSMERVSLNIFNDLYKEISLLNNDYPNFKEWYLEKVYNGFLNNDREILLAINRTESKRINIAGLSILKLNENQKKICTLRTSPKFRRSGIATQLFEKSFEILECSKPLFTVSDFKDSDFSFHTKKYGFKKEFEICDLYKRGHAEFIYNGTL